MIYFIVNENNEVTAKLTGHKGGDIPNMLKVEDCAFSIGDIYNPETQTFTANPKTAIKAQIIEIDMQIEAIEAKSYRPLREIQLGLDLDGTALTKLTEYNTQITNLRTQRAELAAQLN